MNNMTNWVLGFCTVVMGLGGLFVAANAGEGIGYYGGLSMFAFAVLFVFFLIRTSMDHEESKAGH